MSVGAFPRAESTGNALHPPREPLPTNEFDIVIPPPVLECMGEDCTFRGDNDVCGLTQHHIESTEPHFEAHSPLAAKFRELVHLTVWMHECRHREHHNTRELIAPIPEDWVMERAVIESRRLRRIDVSFGAIRGLGKTMQEPGRTITEKEGVKRAQEKLMQKHEALLSQGLCIEVLPEELVTGALLTTAPEMAQARIWSGSEFVLTGNIHKDEAGEALRTAQEIVAALDVAA